MDLLLSHGYSLVADPHEQRIMRPYPPLGLLYISAYLKREDFDVEVYDTTFQTPDDFAAHVARARPPIVGLYANLMTRRTVLESIQACRRAGCHVVVGGPEPANYAAEYLRAGADVVVEGEGELTLAELVPLLLAHRRARARFAPRNAVRVSERANSPDSPVMSNTTDLPDLGHVDGIQYLDATGAVARTPAREQIADLDTLPFPDRTAIDIHRYVETWRTHHGLGSVSLITARGCPYRCRWCSHGVFGFTHRRRSPESIADEVEMILATYSPDMLWYADDVFTIHYGWTRRYAAELRARGIRVPFETISREDRLNEEIVGLLAEMGCRRLWVGSESGSQRVLDAMQRRTDAARVREMVKLLQSRGIEAGIFIMLGYEGEEMQDIDATVAHLKASMPDAFLTTIAYPIKGTPFYEEVADRIVSSEAWELSSDRDLTVRGQPSTKFLRHATRWMVNEVELHRRRLGGRPPWLSPGTYARAKLGRLGMHLTRREREAEPPRP